MARPKQQKETRRLGNRSLVLISESSPNIVNHLVIARSEQLYQTKADEHLKEKKELDDKLFMCAVV
jgi:hypothetical protein